MKKTMSAASLFLSVLPTIVGCGPGSDRQAETRSGSASAPPAIRLAGALTPGEFPVGFRKETLHLANAVEGQPTSLDLYLWFPAVEPARTSEATEPLVFADYYRAQEAEEPEREALREWLRGDMTSPPGLDVATIDAVLDAPMWAQDRAEPARERHPLVLWSYRDSVPTMQAVLNEYLASHGYVVAFAWPSDHAPPFPWQEGLTARDKSDALETQVNLLESVLDSMQSRAWVDADRVAVLSWSYGGESAGELQRRRAEVDLALGIDSTLASGWVFQTADDLANLDRRSLSVPYVLLRNGRPRIGADRSLEPTLLAEVPAGAWYVEFAELSHGNFNVPGGMIPGVLGLDEVSPWAVGGEAAQLGYELVCRHVLGFLDLRQRQEGIDPMVWSTAAPEGFVEVRQHSPL